ncbi:MAG: hypothetical protein IPH72_32795 [Sandaracinaceae bacterium]|nr:hypothetical protein [Sandaracinaceae bacterium]
MVTASRTGTARVWVAATGVMHAELVGHGGAIHAASFSPDGAAVVTASEDGSVCLWDANTGELRATYRAGVRLSLRAAVRPTRRHLERHAPEGRCPGPRGRQWGRGQPVPAPLLHHAEREALLVWR